MSEYKPGLRDRLVWIVMSAALKCATPYYRDFIAMLMHEGREPLLRKLLENP